MRLDTAAAWLEASGTWFAGLLTLALLVWAILHERLYDWLRRPRLAVSIKPYAPDCMKLRFGLQVRKETGVEVAEPVPVYYARMRVHNCGGRSTEAVQVTLKSVEMLHSEGTFQEIPSLSNLNLAWSRQQNGANFVFLPTLQKQAYEHCNLAHVFEPSDRQRQDIRFLFEQKEWPGVHSGQTILSLDVADRAYHLPHLLPPGSYRLRLAVSSADAEPITKTLHVTLNGKWYDNEEQMFSRGLIIHEPTTAREHTGEC